MSWLTYLQVAYAGSLRSSAVTLDYFQNQCNTAFGRKMQQDTDAFNAKYGGFRPNATRVIALNGRCYIAVQQLSQRDGFSLELTRPPPPPLLQRRPLAPHVREAKPDAAVRGKHSHV